MKKKNGLTKKFVRRTVWISTLLMIAFVIAGMILYSNRASILKNRAEKAVKSGEYQQAVNLLEQMEAGDERDELLEETRYKAAEKLLENGRFEEALTAFSKLGAYADAQEKILACKYGIADQLFEKKEYEKAKDAFFSLAGYSDALERYSECRYAIALDLEAKDPEAAFQALYELGSFSDARAHAEQIAVSFTGIQDADAAILRMLGAEGAVEDLYGEIRSKLPGQVLAVGFYHTAGLRSDGTAVACGKNDDGQCNVSGWSGLIAIDCGAYHTVGLKKDGTVIATGRNESGQCNVSGWTDIVAIACTDYDTIGLKSNGTVVHTGYHAYPELSGWSDITVIGGGSYIAAAMNRAGIFYSSHDSARSEAMKGSVAIDVSTGYALGLRPDGTVINTAVENEWKDIIAISAGSTGFMGLDVNGQIFAHWFSERDAIDFTDVSKAVAVAVGGTHSAVLLEDGTVIARGENENGECSTQEWKLGTWTIYAMTQEE